MSIMREYELMGCLPPSQPRGFADSPPKAQEYLAPGGSVNARIH